MNIRVVNDHTIGNLTEFIIIINDVIIPPADPEIIKQINLIDVEKRHVNTVCDKRVYEMYLGEDEFRFFYNYANHVDFLLLESSTIYNALQNCDYDNIGDWPRNILVPAGRMFTDFITETKNNIMVVDEFFS